jgi:hypothetical protein
MLYARSPFEIGLCCCILTYQFRLPICHSVRYKVFDYIRCRRCQKRAESHKVYYLPGNIIVENHKIYIIIFKNNHCPLVVFMGVAVLYVEKLMAEN